MTTPRRSRLCPLPTAAGGGGGAGEVPGRGSGTPGPSRPLIPASLWHDLLDRGVGAEGSEPVRLGEEAQPGVASRASMMASLEGRRRGERKRSRRRSRTRSDRAELGAGGKDDERDVGGRGEGAAQVPAGAVEERGGSGSCPGDSFPDEHHVGVRRARGRDAVEEDPALASALRVGGTRVTSSPVVGRIVVKMQARRSPSGRTPGGRLARAATSGGRPGPWCRPARSPGKPSTGLFSGPAHSSNHRSIRLPGWRAAIAATRSAGPPS